MSSLLTPREARVSKLKLRDSKQSFHIKRHLDQFHPLQE